MTIWPWRTPFPIWNHPVFHVHFSDCCFLTCILISQEEGKVVLYFHLLKNFPEFVVIYTVKGFSIVNEEAVDVFLEFSCFFCDPMDVGNLICVFSAFSKSSLNILKYLVHVLLKPSLENIENYFACVWDECNCEVLWIFFGIAFLWDCNENWPFPFLWPLQSFPFYALTNTVAMNNHVQFFVWTCFQFFFFFLYGHIFSFPEWISRNRIIGHMITLCLTFWGLAK